MMGQVIFYDERHVADMQEKIDRLQNELFDERYKVTALERRRPHWDQGYSKDSIAAQSSTTALSQIWDMLGVTNQTSAVQKLREIITYVRCYS